MKCLFLPSTSLQQLYTMASLIPISTYNLAIKPFTPVPAIEEDYPITIRLTLAAVDPEAIDDKEEPSTLRLLKRTIPFIDDSDEEDFEEGDELDSEDSEEDSEEEEVEQPKKSKKAKAEESEDEDEEDLDIDGSSDEEDDEGVSEFIVCTLSPKVQFQQTIDLTISPDEEVYFVVTGSYPVYLTGNYVEHPADDESDSEDEDVYDLSPDEDEIIHGNGYDLEDLEDESDIEGKIEELVEKDTKSKKREIEEEEPKQSKKAKKAEAKKAEAKKEAEKKSVQFTKELEQGPTGSTLVESKKETKKEKAAKKEDAKKADAKKTDAKKVDAKKTEEEPASKKFPTKTLLGGVIAEDRKVGKGPQAKSGNKVGIRYIGKLKNGKSFDKNTSGKPFVFGLGKGECIKGFDLGVAGMAVGGERRVVIPAKMGYGSQSLPGIPANSELTFDIKLVSLK